MFMFDFVTGSVLDEIMDWMFTYQMVAINYTILLMNGMGVELFALDYVKALQNLFGKFGFALYVVGIVIAVFECALEYQGGRGSIRDTALNILKGFLAAKLFHTLPVVMYLTAIKWQAMMGISFSGASDKGSIGQFAVGVLQNMNSDSNGNVLFYMIVSLLMAYAIIKTFFSNIKRGGILLIQIAVGSLYMISIPRGYLDGFKQWAKQVIGLCLTAFLQTTLLSVGLIIAREHMLLGLGVMLAAGEVPKICGAYGLDTSTKANVMSSVFAANAALNLGRTITKIAV